MLRYNDHLSKLLASVSLLEQRMMAPTDNETEPKTSSLRDTLPKRQTKAEEKEEVYQNTLADDDEEEDAESEQDASEDGQEAFLVDEDSTFRNLHE